MRYRIVMALALLAMGACSSPSQVVSRDATQNRLEQKPQEGSKQTWVHPDGRKCV